MAPVLLDHRDFFHDRELTRSAAESRWNLSIDAPSGTSIGTGGLAISEGELKTGGLYSCTALGIEGSKNLLAHCHGGSDPSILAHWIDTTYAGSPEIEIQLWNYIAAEYDVPMLGAASRQIDRALALMATPYKIVDRGLQDFMRDEVVIGRITKGSSGESAASS